MLLKSSIELPMQNVTLGQCESTSLLKDVDSLKIKNIPNIPLNSTAPLGPIICEV
jgi:hypothetical protein